MPKRDRLLLAIAALVQILLSFLDLAAILLLGLLAAVATAAVSGAEQPGVVERVPVDVPDEPGALLGLASIIGIALISKSLVSLWMTRRVYRFLANRQAVVAAALAEKVLAQPLPQLMRRSSQEISFALSTGVNAATVHTLGPAMVILAEISLICALFVGLFLIDPLVATFTVIFFGGLATLLQLALGKWASYLGSRKREAEVLSIESIQNAIKTYRELAVSGKRGVVVERYTELRWMAARVQADQYILSQAGKYVFEVGLVVGGGTLVVILTITRDVVSAVAILAVFLLATSRLFPSLLRLQSSVISIREASGLSKGTFDLLQSFGSKSVEPLPGSELFLSSCTLAKGIASGYEDFVAQVEVEHLRVSYPDAPHPALVDVSFCLQPGESLAVVGPSGAGKTTLVDALLGLVNFEAGEVRISGMSPESALSKWPGAIAYVPQDVTVIAGSVRSNVALGLDPRFVDDNLVWNALERAHLSEFLSSSRDGLDTLVGEHGAQLSGGQRQRLGIARALYAKPRLLVLDEATSALDAQTEELISRAIQELSGEVTTVVIAHRLATVRKADKVAYLDFGRVRAIGDFYAVRELVPDFDQSAKLLGI